MCRPRFSILSKRSTENPPRGAQRGAGLHAPEAWHRRKDKTMYTDFLAARGYRRVTVERTEKQPGDLVLHRTDREAERVPGRNVVALRRRASK